MSDLLEALIDRKPLASAPAALKRVSFHGVQPGGVTMEVNLTKNAPEGPTFPFEAGIVHRHGKSKGVVVFWGDALHHLRSALPASPEMRAALRDILDEAERGATAAE